MEKEIQFGKMLQKNVDEIIKTIENRASIDHSGNSNVDIQIHFDTTPLAYALACYYYAKGDLKDHEFTKMVQKLNQLLKDRIDQGKKEKDHVDEGAYNRKMRQRGPRYRPNRTFLI